MTITKTSLGDIEGQIANGLHIFRGIPYAETTAGEWRFRRARPKQPWTSVRKALEPHAVAPQLQDVAYAMAGSSVEHLCNENCLELNVWTPGIEVATRPVMVYIHGGGYLYGSSHDEDYNGAALAKAGDVVVVTINYRLGIFGHLYLGAVGGKEFQDSGTLSLTDQIEALRWVKANIAAFGGDPDNVTIFGESCGGLSVSHLTASPLAQGLFQRMIAMSGAAAGRTEQIGIDITAAVMKQAKVKTVTELQTLSMKDLLALQAWALAELGMAEGTFIPVIGPSPALPEDPLELMAKGAGGDVDMMIGYTRDEMRYWEFYYPGLLEKPPAVVRKWASDLFGNAGPKVLDTYARIRPEEKPGELACSIIGDIIFGYMSDQQALRHARHNPRTWMYRVDWRTSMLEGRLGSPHACELPFVFDSFDIPWGKLVAENDTTERRALLAAFQGAFLAFARTGDPNHVGIPQWQPFEEKSRCAMVFDVNTECRTNPVKQELALWDEIIGPEKVSEAPRYFHFPVEESYPTGEAADETAKLSTA
ncbi:MAG TPA: carboxylesterase family protein [Rhizomicrobium sp.]